MWKYASKNTHSYGKKLLEHYPIKFLYLTLYFFVLFGGHSVIAQNDYELGEAALQRGHYEEAIQYLTKGEKNGKTLARLGYAYSQMPPVLIRAYFIWIWAKQTL